MDLEQVRSVVDSAHEAFVAMDSSGRITYWNPQAILTFGWSKEEAIGRDLAETIIPEEHRDAHRRGLKRFLETGEGPVLGKRIEINALHREGHEFPVELTISVDRSDGGYAFNAFLHDISERKQAEQEREELLARVEAMARTDELTGLPNRRDWDGELRRELTRASRMGYPVCVVMLDLDHFKAYNDEHGHPAGDEVLKECANAWRVSLRVTDFVSRYGDDALVARYGGEEFAVLLPDCALEDVPKAVERLRQATPEGQTCSAGVACWDGSEDADALLARADQALYEAKRTGRDRAVTAASEPS